MTNNSSQSGGALTELYAEILKRLNAAANIRDEDVAKTAATIHDWQLRDHAIRVRNARFTLETAELERERICMVRLMATQTLHQPVINMDVP